MKSATVHKSGKALDAFKIHADESNYFALIADPAAEDVSFIQVVEIFEIGGKTPPNRHATADEVFYVLHGEGIATCNGQPIKVNKGDSFLVRAGHEHVVENTGTTRLYCLTTMVPNEGFAELIRAGVPWQLDETDLEVLT